MLKKINVVLQLALISLSLVLVSCNSVDKISGVDQEASFAVENAAFDHGKIKQAIKDVLEDRLLIEDPFAPGILAPAIQAAVFLPDGHVIEVAVGLANQETETKMHEKSQILGGNGGDLFLIVPVLKLIEEGVMNLTDVVSDYFLPGSDVLRGVANANDMTIRHLIDGHGGMGGLNASFSYLIDVAFNPGRIRSRDELLQFAIDVGPVFPPGTVGKTSWLGDRFLLVYLAERVTGKGIHELVQEKVVEPLGLKRTTPVGPGDKNAYNLANHYPHPVPFGGLFSFPVIDESGLVVFDPSIFGFSEIYQTAGDRARVVHTILSGGFFDPAFEPIFLAERPLTNFFGLPQLTQTIAGYIGTPDIDFDERRFDFGHHIFLTTTHPLFKEKTAFYSELLDRGPMTVVIHSTRFMGNPWRRDTHTGVVQAVLDNIKQ